MENKEIMNIKYKIREVQGLVYALNDYINIYGSSLNNNSSIIIIFNDLSYNLNRLSESMTKDEKDVWDIDSINFAEHYSNQYTTLNTHAAQLLEVAQDCSNKIIKNYYKSYEFPEHLKEQIYNIYQIISESNLSKVISEELSMYR